MAITAHTTERDEQMSLDAGMVAHINKPYSLQRLKRLLTTVEPVEKTDDED